MHHKKSSAENKFTADAMRKLSETLGLQRKEFMGTFIDPEIRERID